MSWIVPHAITEGARDHMTRVTSTATTALLGRKNFEGFGGFEVPDPDPRLDRIGEVPGDPRLTRPHRR